MLDKNHLIRYKVLVVEDFIADFEIYEHYFKKDKSYYYEIVHAETGSEALALLLNYTPDLIILDFSLPDIDGLRLIEAIKKIDKLLYVPIVMLTGQGNEEIALKAMKKNINDYLVKGELNFHKFIKVVYQTITAIEHTRKRAIEQVLDVLIVDDSEADLEFYERLLQKDTDYFFNVYTAMNAKEGLAICQEKKLDIILCDYELPDQNGLVLISQIQKIINIEHFPIILITGKGNEQLVAQALKQGVSDYLVKQYMTPEKLCESVKENIQKSRLLTQINKTNHQQILLSKISLNIRQSLDLQTILDTSVTQVKKFMQCDRVLIYKIIPEKGGKVIAESVNPPFTKTLEMNLNETFFSDHENRREYLSQRQVIHDINKANLHPSYREILEKLQIQSSLSLPIIIDHLDETLWGLLVLHFCKNNHHWEESEVAFLQEISSQISIGVQQGLLVQEIAKERDRANEATKAKSFFLANMSHEIRTPMNGILGMAELLSLCDLSEEAKSYVKIIQSSGKNLLNLINDILDLSKLESGSINLKVEQFDLHDLVEEMLKLFQVSLMEKKLNVILDFAENLPQKYLGDPYRLKQILINLIGNAVKFTVQGGIKITIKQADESSDDEILSLLQSDEMLLYFGVQDTGIGISSEDQEKLFQPFSQVENLTKKNFGGTGLGLSISKKLTALMGGKIGVNSQVNQGSTFWFTVVLKVVDYHLKFSPSLPSDSPVYHQVPMVNKEKILVVEDIRVNQIVLKEQLKRLGYYCDIASNGEEALDLLENYSYKLVLMDCQMPFLDGYETTRAIRNNEKIKELVVIGLTAFAMKEDREICLDSGMNDYLAKPCSIPELESIIKKWS